MKTPLHLYVQLENQIIADFSLGRIDLKTALRELGNERRQINWDLNSLLPLDYNGEGIS